MRIRDILRKKGSAVATVRPDATVRELLAKLAELNIGAVVVSPDGNAIAGIVSERDVVRRLHERGAGLLDAPVSEIMTVEVRTCAPETTVDELRRTMTEYRIRHVPVVSGGRMVGLVSIGDVVKSAIDELETEREYLVGYLHG
ncbi:CBS domain-containing protein [Thermobispora bispora]|jgi:CBS domain-containing protein|uniref:Putative signal transduction protein with CBS domains n=1 Tax=Thermobispora bispora (strain ATCC 19993 / DSM 43833 / CBS 139.67 / JCM 10125 / KCTC 9307 / NBRC 14880 / R51) TaxID=469371 RepID=D6YAW3_THEBD|nr:CBS domain-containing protein [Thermobispora bispora]ADG88330.1 putative signal transduction protein with CBS domains [Thermobispora bispora DSM 43833]MBO2474934.1 CBS domain-containing protein [Actinomycetales bacterium]MDI9580736.1 CBS domain-containing protein [Thermobispora sp.]QSI48149.1 CBS domain-containing protein [Thermobispora bispora]